MEYDKNSRELMLQKFDFRAPTLADSGAIIDFLLKHFITNEPYCKAIKATAEECRRYVEHSVLKCLHYNFSQIAFEKGTEVIAGVRLTTVSHRDASKEYQPFELTKEDFPERVAPLFERYEKCEREFWDLVPSDVNKVLRIELSGVHPKHWRQGLYYFLGHYGMDYKQLKAQGFSGLTAETPVPAKISERLGFKRLGKAYTVDGIEVPDGTDGIRIIYCDFNNL